MKRPGRYLGRNEGTETPGNLIFFDTESYSTPDPYGGRKKRLSLRLWTAIRCRIEGDKITRRSICKGKTADEFWQWIDSVSDDQRRTWLFAHNLCHDLTQLSYWRKLDERHFTLDPLFSKPKNASEKPKVTWIGKLCIDARRSFVVCRRLLKKYHFVDTGNYWPKSLRSIGNAYGLEKGTMPDESASDDEWYAYCLRDSQVIEFAVCNMLSLWRHEDCGVFQATGPMLAMQNFMHTCDILTPDGKSVDIVCEPDAKQHDLERKAYYGGRIQCFYVGTAKGKIYHLDVNSLYPYVMRNKSYPRRFVRYENGPGVDRVQSACECYGVVATVHISSRHHTFPVRVNGKQYHCCGKFWTELCGPELQHAIESGCVDRIGIAQFYSIAPLFRKWVDKWYIRKLDAKLRGHDGIGDYEFAKLILNSLSGKWAQSGRTWIDSPGRYSLVRWGGYARLDKDTGTIRMCRGVAGYEQTIGASSEPKHAFPAISAFITAYAREYMRKVIELCPHRSVYYMATDSLICSSDAYESLRQNGCIGEDEIGMFKVVGTHDEAKIHGANCYSLDGRYTASGVYGKSIGETGEPKPVDVFEPVSSVLQAGGISTITIETVEPPIPRFEFRGTIGSDGYWSPYRLGDDTDFSDSPPEYTEDILPIESRGKD